MCCMPVGNHGQFDIHSFFLHDLTSVLFQNTHSFISGIHLPLPIAVLHTEEQQMLPATGFKATDPFGLSYHSWILPFGSQGCSWWSWGHGAAYALPDVTRKKTVSISSPEWV